jgi:hypothetical protein
MPVTPAREWGLGHPTPVGGGPLFLLRPPLPFYERGWEEHTV